jgi:hypothetical protein
MKYIVKTGRPMGEVSMAMIKAARIGPATVHQLAERACVGYDAARFKAKDLVRAGILVPTGADRPRVLAVREVKESQTNDSFELMDFYFRTLKAEPVEGE